MELATPKLRSGSYFPEWLLDRRRRAEQALVSVVATAYLLGVSTRRVDKLVEQFGIKGISRSQVSELAKSLDVQVAAFRNRPLDAGPYTFVGVDALTQKVREGGGIVNVHVLVATAVNADGRREILGCEVTSGEDGAGWPAFLRGLAGVQLVVSDAHRDRVDAIAYVGAQNGGRLIEAGDEAESLAVRFEEIGALAESRDASRDLIVRTMRMYE